jgi:hypothetical protein
LLINPQFVDEHAGTPEKLMMLVMHELHHVLLGHTTLFPRVTKVQNFVFDAVINGILSRMFPRPEYTAIFTDTYSAERFPECLLRPPPGWPDNAEPIASALQALPEEHRARAQEVHTALYSSAGASYDEVYAVLPKILLNLRLGDDFLTGIPLLGDHSEKAIADGQLENLSPMLFDIVRELVEQWPQPPDPIRGRSLAEVLRVSTVSPRREPSNRAILRRLIRKVATDSGFGRVRRVCDDSMEAFTPLPTMARRSMVLRAMGAQTLLHPASVPWRRRAATGEKVRVYIDVSGSMDSVLKALYGAVLDCQNLVFRTVHLFSTKVADMSLADLKAGRCESTGGTDIGCVAEHMTRNRVTRALLITDGWVGTPHGEHFDTLAKARLAVAYLGSSFNQTDLESVANHTSILKTGARP